MVKMYVICRLSKPGKFWRALEDPAIVFEGAQTVSPSRKSKIKSKFRNSKKSQILREIHNLSMILRTEKVQNLTQ